MVGTTPNTRPAADALCKGLDVGITEFIRFVPDDEVSPEDIQHIEKRSQFVKKTTEQVYKYRDKE
ncbi:hypothetical protein CF651_26580 [Paenibacillus rigui]|uniref:Uncharacterized protein n=1 Tax=Paenibacillus rigui TaxID=554312 RepID=A0A229UIQ9_9BACL|nr:hypothetical protein CF651_26580 [Paenibacillus rigui]